MKSKLFRDKRTGEIVDSFLISEISHYEEVDEADIAESELAEKDLEKEHSCEEYDPACFFCVDRLMKKSAQNRQDRIAWLKRFISSWKGKEQTFYFEGSKYHEQDIYEAEEELKTILNQ